MIASRVAPELLAPAGSPACLPAAVAGGADAVYLGLTRFSARARAENFAVESLHHHVGYLHGHGLRCHVTLNTLLRDRELPAAVATAEQVAEAGADALIVQDLGLWRILRRELPDLELHASTQMTVHSPEQIELLAEIGARRIILARELAMHELDACVKVARRHGVETECFVHGALCYAYSGQCSMSAMATGRSANRGACEQCCRFDYDDGERHGPLLSMCDLNLLERIPDLAASGIACFKIEGRLKGPEYVYAVCQAYRAAIDAWRTDSRLDTEHWQRRLREVFARPFTSGALGGELGEAGRVTGSTGRHGDADALMLRVSRRGGTALLASDGEIGAGHGFSFTLADGSEGGFLVTHARRESPSTWQCRIRIAERGPHLPEKLALYRNTDQQRDAEARRDMARFALPPPPPPSVPVQITVAARVGRAVELSLHASDGRSARVLGPAVEPAERQPLTREALASTVGALGGSGFRVGGWRLELDGDAFVPASILKALRRDAINALASQPGAPRPRWELPAPGERRVPLLVAAVAGDLEAAHGLLAAGADQVWLDDPRLDLWRDTPPSLPSPAPGMYLRHPATAPVSPHLATLGWPVAAGHLGVLRAAHEAGLEVIADVGLNVANHAAADALAELGAVAAVVSPELDPAHIHDLVTRTELPCLALAAGYPLLMASRQDHGLEPGQRRPLTARQSGVTFQLTRHVSGVTTIRGDAEVDRLEEITALQPLLAGVLLETGSLPAAEAVDLVTRARRAADAHPIRR